MASCFFVSDLHGSVKRYEKFFSMIGRERPDAVFLGGDLLPSGMFAYSSKGHIPADFFELVISRGFSSLREKLKDRYPRVFLILGNDDSKIYEKLFTEGESRKLWHYVHLKKMECNGHFVYGYSYIPPTPFLMKDWEKYDVSRYVDPGCTPPESGYGSRRNEGSHFAVSTIKDDIDLLINEDDLSNSIFLFHSPPYRTNLDRAALDGKMFDHAPLDVHVGSIAIQRFIKEKQPLLTLHGHIHESAAITGSWRDRIGNTHCFSAAHDGVELALVRFDTRDLENATRDLL